eukprot:jgi/Picre1/28538/NNA_003940.t1
MFAIAHMALCNHSKPPADAPLADPTLVLSNPHRGVIDIIKNARLRHRIVLLGFTWVATTVTYVSIIMMFDAIPGDTGTTSSGMELAFTGFTYEIPGIAIAGLLAERLGRKYAALAALVECGCCLIGSSILGRMVHVQHALIVASRFGIAAAVSSILILSWELFPTIVVYQGIGLLHTVASFTVCSTPWLALAAFNLKSALVPLSICGSLCLGAAIVVTLLPETKDVPIPATIQDMVEWLPLEWLQRPAMAIIIRHGWFQSSLPMNESQPNFDSEQPLTVEEYLRRVRFEARHLPKVVRCDVTPTTTALGDKGEEENNKKGVQFLGYFVSMRRVLREYGDAASVDLYEFERLGPCGQTHWHVFESLQGCARLRGAQDPRPNDDELSLLNLVIVICGGLFRQDEELARVWDEELNLRGTMMKGANRLVLLLLSEKRENMVNTLEETRNRFRDAAGNVYDVITDASGAATNFVRDKAGTIYDVTQMAGEFLYDSVRDYPGQLRDSAMETYNEFRETAVDTAEAMRTIGDAARDAIPRLPDVTEMHKPMAWARTFALNNLYLEDFTGTVEDQINPSKKVKCHHPKFTFEKFKGVYTSKHHTAPKFTSKECKYTKSHGNPDEIVLWEFDGHGDFDAASTMKSLQDSLVAAFDGENIESDINQFVEEMPEIEDVEADFLDLITSGLPDVKMT